MSDRPTCWLISWPVTSERTAGRAQWLEALLDDGHRTARAVVSTQLPSSVRPRSREWAGLSRTNGGLRTGRGPVPWRAAQSGSMLTRRSQSEMQGARRLFLRFSLRTLVDEDRLVHQRLLESARRHCGRGQGPAGRHHELSAFLSCLLLWLARPVVDSHLPRAVFCPRRCIPLGLLLIRIILKGAGPACRGLLSCTLPCAWGPLTALRHSQLAPCSFQHTTSAPLGFTTEIQSDKISVCNFRVSATQLKTQRTG